MSVGARAIKWQLLRAYAVKEEQVKYSPSWGVWGTAENAYTNRTYGAMFTAPQDYNLSAVEVPLSRHASYAPCAQGKIEIWLGPTCGGSRGTLVGSVTKTLPALPVTPAYLWVKFDFDPTLPIINGNTYCYLAVGCALWAGTTFYRLHRGDALADGVNLCRVIWRGELSSPYLWCDAAVSHPFKMYEK